VAQKPARQIAAHARGHTGRDRAVFGEAGGGCRVQETDIPLCYAQDAGESGLAIDYGAGTVVESGIYAYKISLGAAPTNINKAVTVSVVASPSEFCTGTQFAATHRANCPTCYYRHSRSG